MLSSLILAVAGLSQITFLEREAVITNALNDTHGVPSLYKNHNVMRSLISCLIDNDGYTDIETLASFIESRCDKRSKFNQCLQDVTALSKQYLNEQDSKLSDILEKIDQQLLHDFCKNSFREIVLNGFNIEEELKNCSLKLFIILDSSTPYRNMKNITCRQVEDAEWCINKYVNKKSPLLANTINIIGKNLCSKTHKLSKRSIILHRFIRQVGGSHKTHKIEQKVKNLCITNGHSSEKLENTLTKFRTCLDEKQMFLTPKQEFLQHLDKCSKEPSELFKSCLPEKYKYLPDLFIKIMESVISLLYDDFVIIESELTPCLPKLRSNESIEEHEKCVAKVKDNIEDDLVDSKEKFCNSWIPMNECYVKEIKKQCKSSPELTKFQNDFMKAVEKPCENK